MEGTPADLTVYIDTNIAHDHTYYGNGCTNGWGADGKGGSDTPCETRIVETPGEEEQKNGTYYHFQAASSGSGAAVTTKYDSVPDTFCPFGWQVPYDGTGGDYYDTSKSWKFLLSSYSIPNDEGGARTLREYPFNISSSGRFSWEFGRLYNMPGSAWLWSGNAEAQIWARHFYVWGTGPGISTYQKYTGFTVRCILFLDANFIDGTEASAYVSGDPTRSLLQYQNENYEIDRSFFGKGCINGWGQDGTGGSDIPCTTRIVKTADNEDQKNGTYYNYQSTTSGSGASLKTDNANAPDTFCPLGWQLPYGSTGGVYYDKSKSWRFLFDAYDISYNEGNEPSSVKLRSYPLSYILGGYFGGATGRLYHQGDEGYHWGSTNNNSIYAYRITMWPRGLRSAEINSKLSQYPIRCL
ncbi:hypothetical protein IKE07_00830 [Candidatus Saccharibacteria bacterium]|nr:hypothetical protein [Candidatus Saccharibacteria bacterium]